MCEPMLLSLEGDLANANVGVEVSPTVLRDLRRLGRRHGFAVAPPRSFGEAIETDAWQRLRATREDAAVAPS
jgi:hypothetical protein